jgi:hypothetical protein
MYHLEANMKDTITYRPTIVPEKLTQIIKKLHYTKVNRFIDEAVKEKISREANDPRGAKAEALLGEVMEVLDKYKGIKFLKPTPGLAKEIDQRADAIVSGKAKGYRYKGNLKEFLKEH